MAQFDFYDPRFQGLATLAAGLLSQSGWQPQRVSLGQAFGQSVPPALQAMTQARQQQISMEDLKQLRLMRELQMKKLGFEIGQEEALPGQLNQWARLVSDADLMGGNQPQVGQTTLLPQFQAPAAPTPMAPYDPNQVMQQNLLGPFAADVRQPGVPHGTAPVTAAPPGDLQLRDTEVLGSQAQGLYDFADKLELDFANRFPNPHPNLAKAAEKQIASIRARAERLDKIIERRNTQRGQGFEVIAETAGLMKGTPEYDAARRNWIVKQTEFAPPQQQTITVDARSFEKTAGAERAKAVQERQTAAMKTSDFAGTVRLLTDVLEGYSGGPLTQFQAQIGRVFPESEYGKIASIDDLAKGLIGKAAPMIRATGSGATSDFEFKQFMAALPSLAATPDGRRMMADIAERMSEREIAASDIFTELAQKGDVSLSQWRTETRKRLGGLFSKDELNLLRSGRTGRPPGTMRRLP